MKAIAWLLLPLTLLLGIALAIPTPAYAQGTFTDGNPWAHTNGTLTYWTKVQGAYVLSGDGQILTLGADGTGAAILEARFYHGGGAFNITTQYRRSTPTPPLIQVYTSDNQLAQSCGLALASSVTTNDCNANLPAGTYRVVINRSVTTGSYFELHSIAITAQWINPTPPTPTPTPPPAGASGLGAATCYLIVDSSNNVLTATNTITGAGTITGTSTVTVPANLLLNSGYEVGTVAPDNWRFDQPTYAPNMWQMTLDHGRVLSLLNYPHPSVTTRQDITDLPPAPAYAFGIDAKGGGAVTVRAGFIPTGSGGGGGGGGIVTFDTMGVDPDQFTFTPVITTWQTFSHTTVISGNRYIAVTTPANVDGNLQLQIDNPFLVPVQVDPLTGAVLGVYCPAIGQKYGATPLPPPEEGGGGGYIVPLAGAAGGKCMLCPQPSFNLSLNAIGSWFAYLYCALSNIILCYVFGWLFNILNGVLWVGGVLTSLANATIGGLNIFLGWVSTAAQATLNWGAVVYLGARDLLGMALAWVGGVIGNILNGIAYIAVRLASIINPGNAWGLLVALGTMVLTLIDFVVSPFLALINITVAIAETVWEVATAVVNALTATPEDIDQWATSPDANINSDMIIVLLWIMGSVDHALAVYHMIPAVYMVVGGMGLMAFKKWSEKWETVLPI